jgi:hypothetical protein
MTIISSTVWDSGSTSWDAGSSIWDPHRQIDGTVVNLAFAANDASVARTLIGIVNVPSITLGVYSANVARTTNVTLDALVLTSYDTDVDYESLISVGNLPSLVITGTDMVVTFTNRNLTFFLSQII